MGKGLRRAGDLTIRETVVQLRRGILSSIAVLKMNQARPPRLPQPGEDYPDSDPDESGNQNASEQSDKKPGPTRIQLFLVLSQLAQKIPDLMANP